MFGISYGDEDEEENDVTLVNTIEVVDGLSISDIDWNYTGIFPQKIKLIFAKKKDNKKRNGDTIGIRRVNCKVKNNRDMASFMHYALV